MDGDNGSKSFFGNRLLIPRSKTMRYIYCYSLIKILVCNIYLKVLYTTAGIETWASFVNSRNYINPSD